MNTPVALIIFNRPDTTNQVLAEIAKAKPSKLYVIADGPREDHPEDVEKCSAAREVIEGVDWKCEVIKNYSDVNLGCGKRPATGISWVFDHVEEAIILEDDCVPHPTFLRFCEELLERFRYDERIMMIGGRSNLYDQERTQYSYYFSRLPSCWGWSTWRRAWRHHDMEINLWPSLRDTSWLLDILSDPVEIEFWRNIFDKAYTGAGNVNYWDFQWVFTCWAHNGLTILPTKELVSNIGFGEEATHTKSLNDKRANLPVAEMVFPLKHPPYMVRNREADELRFKYYGPSKRFNQRPSLLLRLRGQFFAVMPGPLQKLIAHLRTKGHR